MLQRALDWVGMVSVVLLGSAVARTTLGGGLGSTELGPLDWALLVLSIPAGLIAADLLSGLAHWLADRVLPEDTAFFGPYFVQPFREHHRQPRGILLHDWVETIGNTCITVAPLLAISLVAIESMSAGSARAALGALTLSLATSLCLTNQIHKWAHSELPGGWIGALQRSGVVLSPRHHARHHTPPYDVRYCITTGWFNPALDRIRFFARAEGALCRLGLLETGPDLPSDRQRHGARPTDDSPAEDDLERLSAS